MEQQDPTITRLLNGWWWGAGIDAGGGAQMDEGARMDEGAQMDGGAGKRGGVDVLRSHS